MTQCRSLTLFASRARERSDHVGRRKTQRRSVVRCHHENGWTADSASVPKTMMYTMMCHGCATIKGSSLTPFSVLEVVTCDRHLFRFDLHCRPVPIFPAKVEHRRSVPAFVEERCVGSNGVPFTAQYHLVYSVRHSTPCIGHQRDCCYLRMSICRPPSRDTSGKLSVQLAVRKSKADHALIWNDGSRCNPRARGHGFDSGSGGQVRAGQQQNGIFVVARS